MKLAFGFQPGSKVTLEHEGRSKTVDRWGEAHRVLSGHAGRINVYDDTIVSTPTGKAIQRKDGKTTLNLLDETAAGEITVPLSGNRTGIIETVAKRQAGGWAKGDYYMLETDPVTGDLIVEPGRNHRKVYVTGGAHGLTRAAIAAQAGVSEATVTNTWLKARPQWGGTPDKAFEKSVGLSFWGELTNNSDNDIPAHSNWLLLERGYDYTDHVWGGNQGYLSREIEAESLLHPIVVDAYGDGDRPIVDGVSTWQTSAKKAFVVIRNLQTRHANGSAGSFDISYSAHFIGDSLYSYRGSFTSQSITTDEHYLPHHAYYRCMTFQASNDVPGNGEVGKDPTQWVPLQNHTQGLYASGLASLLIQDVLMDHNGWRPGYSETGLDPAFPHPPSMYTHNFYISHELNDVCIDGVITARAASQGIQNRPGGYVSNTLYLDNNIAGNDLGGDSDGAGPIKQYGLYDGNVITSAANKQAIDIGARGRGLEVVSYEASLVGNIVTHRADPNNTAEIAARPHGNQPAVFGRGDNFENALFNDTRVHNWTPSWDNSLALGLDQQVLDQTTIQKFAEAHPGVAGNTIADLMGYLRDLDPRQWRQELDAILEYFRTPFGLYVPKRTAATECVFLPDYRGEGFRFDNRLNWSTGDVPMTGDTLDLDGNDVLFGRYTRAFPAIKAGGMRTTFSSGKFTVTGLIETSHVEVRNCGQAFLPGGTGIDYTVKDHGRLVLAGAAEGGVSVAHRAECLFGPVLTIPAGKELTLMGGDCWAGWDGTGTATVTGAFGFVASAGKIGKLQRFKRNGNHADPTVTATVNLTALRIDATGLGPGTYDLGGGTGTGITYVNQGATLPAGVTLTNGKLTLVVL